MFKTILCAVDGSDHAMRALEAAVAIAEKFGGALHVITVPEVIVTGMEVVGGIALPANTPEEMRRLGEGILEHAEAHVQQLGGKLASKEVVMGEPAETIINRARLEGADLIVMGRRGLGAFRGLLFGSTSQEVMQKADCAVLTVR